MSGRKVIVRIEEPTDVKHGKRPEERSAEELLEFGVAIVDKPPGPTSHEVSSWVRRIMGARKAGHSGTLDPNVSGVLPVGLNAATKAMGFLLKSSKEYVGIMRFHRKVEEGDVRRAFEAFTGEISQMPPVRSAVRRCERRRKVYYLRLLEYKDPEVLFLVGCEAGTYVRKLCFDIGRFLGTGAHMLELRRTRVGSMDESMACTLQDLSDAVWLWKERGDETALRRCVVPVERTIDLPRVWLRDSTVESICSGAALGVPGIARLEEGIAKGETIALMSLKGELVAVARAEMTSAEMAEREKGIAARTLRVMMAQGTYPRMWVKKSEKTEGK